MEQPKDLDNEKKEKESLDWRDTMSQMEIMRLLSLQSNSEKTASRKRSFSLDPEKREIDGIWKIQH